MQYSQYSIINTVTLIMNIISESAKPLHHQHLNLRQEVSLGIAKQL